MVNRTRPPVYTVTAVNHHISSLFSEDPVLNHIYVRGELSNVKYAGSGVCNTRQVRAKKQPTHGMPYSITIRVPAVGGCILQMKRKIK